MVNTHLKYSNEDCWLKEPAQNRVQLHAVFRWCCCYAPGYAIVCSYMRKLRLKPWNSTHMCMHVNTSLQSYVTLVTLCSFGLTLRSIRVTVQSYTLTLP